MAQTFDPDKVMLQDTLGKEVTSAQFDTHFTKELVTTSKTVQLGRRIEMGNQKIVKRSLGFGELSDSYWVGEGEKIGVANIDGRDYTLEAKKIAVILPVTHEFLSYTWSNYFTDVVPEIVDKFNKEIDGQAFLGIGQRSTNVFGHNVLSAAETDGNVITGGLSLESILDAEALPENEPNAFVGHRKLGRDLRGLVDPNTSQYLFDRNTSTIDGLPYHELKLPNGVAFPDDTILVGDFNDLLYGIPQGTQLRLKLGDQATLTTIQNAGPDSGDVQLFEQDMQALRAIFEFAVAIPDGRNFSVIKGQEEITGV